MTSLDAWGRQVVGQTIDMDGWYGAQCWDLIAHWLAACGVPVALTYTASSGPLAGLAGSLVYSFPARPGIERYVDLVPATGPFQAGDVLVWGRTSTFPDTHTAVAAGPASGGQIPVITQNDGSAAAASGAARRGTLTTAGLLGALRPKSLTTLATRRLPMFDLYTTGPKPSGPFHSGRIITSYGSHWVPNPQIWGLLLRRRNAALKPEISDPMLDAEHDIINGYLATIHRAEMTGIGFDPAKWLSAVNDALAKLGKGIKIDSATVSVDPQAIAQAVELATPRIAAALVKQAGQVMAK